MKIIKLDSHYKDELNNIQEDKEDYEKTIINMEDLMIVKNDKNEKILNSVKLELNYSSAEIFVTQGCNLRCIYCYGDGGEYNDKGVMDLETGKDSIKYAIENCRRDNICITFFGGEPLINFKLVKELVEYSKELAKGNKKKLEFAITTNATLVDEKISKFFKENKFSITVSIDGNAEIHNQNRYYINKVGSYDDTVKGIKLLLKYNNSVSARATANPKNMNFIKTQEALEKIGVKKIYISPSINLFTTEESYKRLKNQYLELIDKFTKLINDDKYEEAKRIYTVFKTLGQIHRGGFREKFCGAGVNLIAVDRQGNLYPCHRFVGNKQYIIGNVYCGVNKDKYQKGVRDELTLKNRNKCDECWAYAICGGGCPSENFLSNGSARKPIEDYCVVKQNVIEEMIKIYIKLGQEKREKLFGRENK